MVFFYSDDCSACHAALGEDLGDAKLPANVMAVRLEDCKELFDEFNIMLLPTFLVFDKEGKLAARANTVEELKTALGG
jgi:hypothetical protein